MNIKLLNPYLIINLILLLLIISCSSNANTVAQSLKPISLDKWETIKIQSATDPLGEIKNLKSKVRLLKDLKGFSHCTALDITVVKDRQDDFNIGLVVCPKNNYYFCFGAFEKCITPKVSVEQDNDILSWSYYSDFGKRTYRIDFKSQELVYRIQDRSCWVPYPHGCLIHGFGWIDTYVYVFAAQPGKQLKGSK